MKVYANIKQEVIVNPLDIIEELRIKELGDWKSWVFEKEGKYYEGFETGAGSHSWDDEEEISKEKYDYIRALEIIKTYIKQKN